MRKRGKLRSASFAAGIVSMVFLVVLLLEAGLACFVKAKSMENEALRKRGSGPFYFVLYELIVHFSFVELALVIIPVLCCNLIVAFLLIYGCAREIKVLLLPWLIVSAIEISILFLIGLFDTSRFIIWTFYLYDPFFRISLFFLFVVFVSLWSCVLGYYRSFFRNVPNSRETNFGSSPRTLNSCTL